MLKLKAKIRENKKVDKIREEGRIPAITYGNGVENTMIDLDYQDMKKALETAGESTLIELAIDDKKPLTVLVQETQYNPVTDEIAHIDFYQIKEGEKITVSIEFNFVGESPAVQQLGGILVKPHDKVEVRCLPKDLISHIDVDISTLKAFDDSIHVSHLNIPETLEVLDADIVVASVTPPRKKEVSEEVLSESASAEAGDAKVDAGKDKEEKSEDSSEK